MRPNEVINYRLQSYLSYPIQQRCDELTRLINETNSKDLKDAFPIILESIFNIPGWGLRTLDKNIGTLDGAYILKFLDPLGPLFLLAYQLGTDYFLKYELSLSSLPSKLRRDLESGASVSTLFCDKVFYDQQTRRPTTLLLSPFELLIFRYALHILPKLQPEVWMDSIYVLLTERYLCHFLPCDPQAPPVLPHVPYMAQANQRSPAPASPFTQLTSPSKPGHQMSLLKSSVVLNFTSSPTNASPGGPASQNALIDIWRTRILAQVLVHVWLSVDIQNQGSPQMRASYVDQSTLSSVEHARMVRCLIKHLHYFANSACYTNPTAMDEMKRQILPLSKIQMYKYLTHTMNNWPLDTSFRVILEAWLSYIQPWRYTNLSNYSRQENEESGRPVDCRWQIFIAEHLPAYTCVFRQLLARFQRMDLASLKNTIMLHRLIKVFSLGNLKEMLIEVEESLSCRPNESSYSRSDSPSFNLADTSSLDMNPQMRFQSAALKAISDLEGSDAKYINLFSTDTKFKIISFVEDTLALARRRADRLLKEQAQHQRSAGFWSWFFGSSDSGVEEYTLEDRQRVVQILQHASDQFASLFEIDICHSSLNDNYNLDQSQDISTGSAHLNTTFLNDVSGHSSLWRSAEPGVECEGDPDKRLISSSEIAWLVRMFHDISCYINLQYGDEIQLIYAQQDMTGRLARQILQPPCMFYVYERGKEGYKTRCEKTLPARLSLRALAKKDLLVCLCLYCIVAMLFGFSPISSLFLPAVIYFGIISVKALLE